MAKTLAISLLVSAVSTAAADSATCSVQFDAEMSNMDMSGEIIGQKWANTSDDCCGLCAQEAGCEGYAYRGDTCYLKTGYAGTYEHANVTTRLRKDRPQCSSEYDVEVPGMDMSGDLIATKLALTSDACCSMCDDEPACEGFVFNHRHCYLKKGYTGMYANPDAVARLKHSVATCSSTLSVSMWNTDLSGNLINKKYASSIAGCCPLCERTPGCGGFSFANETCFLKSGVTGTYSHSGVVTVIKSVDPPKCSPDYSDEKSDCDVSGTLIAEKWAQTSDACCAHCDGEHGCEGFAFTNNMCYLKGGVQGTYPNDGVVCRMKSHGRRLGTWIV